jgi:hypothetical protein
MLPGERRLVIPAVISMATLALVALAVAISRTSSAASGAVPRSAAAPVIRIDRDDTGSCIPERPALQERCDPIRQLLWDDADNAFDSFLSRLGVTTMGPADVRAARVRFRADAGDLRTIEGLARQSGRADVRVVAIAPAPNDQTREYVEIRNIGSAAARLETLYLSGPGDAYTFRFAPVFRFPGTLAPNESCRVYTRRAGQPDACAGEWNATPSSGIWPLSGGWVVLSTRADGSMGENIDRWWYGPVSGGP